MTTWTTRPTVTTTFTPRPSIQSDLGYGLDYDDSIMTNEIDERIVFNTGVFTPTPTIWTNNR